jgi:ATP-dependent Clp protease ATP-binding subunit ClpA
MARSRFPTSLRHRQQCASGSGTTGFWHETYFRGGQVEFRFRSLTPDDLSQIVRIQLRQLAARADGVGVTLEVDEAAEVWLAARGYDPDYGARPLRRVIQRELSDRLAVLLLDGTFQAGDTVHFGVAEDRLSFY